jgi:Glycosyltransferase family 87
MSARRRVYAAAMAKRPIPAAPDPARTAVMARLLTYLVVLGLIAAAAWVYRSGYYAGRPFPRNTFLFSPGDHYADLFNLLAPVEHGDPYSLPFASYPPFSYVMIYPFTWVSHDGAIALYIGVLVAGLGAFLWRELDVLPGVDRFGCVVLLGAASYPFLFMVDRANFEAFVVLWLLLAVWAVQTDRRFVAAVAIGAAGAMKGYPLAFAVLFLVRRDWRSIAVVGVTTVVLTFLATGFYGFDPIDTWDRLSSRLDYYRAVYITGDAGLAFGTSLYGAVKLVAVDVFGADASGVMALYTPYTVFALALFASFTLVLWLRRRTVALWEEVAVLSMAIIVLPQVSADYKLLHLIAPVALFLRYGVADSWRWIYLAGFAILMVPKPYHLLREDGTGLGVVLNPIVMLAMSIAIVVRVLRRREVDAGLAGPSMEPQAAHAVTARGSSPA